MIFFIRYWKYIALVLAVLSLVGALWCYGQIRYADGYDTAMAQVATAKAKADEETRAKQATIKRKSQGVEDEIRKDSGDRPTGPVIKRQLERLRSQR